MPAIKKKYANFLFFSIIFYPLINQNYFNLINCINEYLQLLLYLNF